MMRRGTGYEGPIRHRDQWEDNDASDYSQDDDSTQSSRYHQSSQNHTYDTALPRRPSSTNKDRPSGIPRPGSHTPSRLPSALKAPRSRSYSSSSSADSQATNEEIIPPVPQIPSNRGRSGATKTSGQESGGRVESAYGSNTDHSQARTQSSLSRRPTSVSRSRSRSYTRTGSTVPECPPPLPGSNSDSDGSREFEAPPIIQDSERTPRRASWAKDRRRFADPAFSAQSAGAGLPHVASEGTRYNQPSTPVASGRKSALKTPTNFRNSVVPSTLAPPIPNRIPPATTKPSWVPIEERQSSDYEDSTQASSRSSSSTGTGNIQHNSSHRNSDKSSHVSSRRSSSHQRALPPNESSRAEPPRPLPSATKSGATPNTSLPSRNHYSSVYSKGKSDEPCDKTELDVVHISSMMDMPLPTPPLPQFDTVVKNRTPRQESTSGPEQTEQLQETVSSPVETMLMGSAGAAAANATPNARRVSTPGRPPRESAIYVPSTPAASAPPGARRRSEPSPNKTTPGPSTRDQSSKDREPTPSILQRLVRRASLSTGKSPKLGSTSKSPKSVSTPKSQLDVDHDATESPFGLELETPRASTGAGTDHSMSGRAGAGSITQAGRENQSERYKNRQSSIYQGTMAPTANEVEKPRSKIVDAVSENNTEKLGSPFMGDGSPRFGIDERFRSPKKRTKSGLRHATFGESSEGPSQEIYDYYAGNEVVENTEDYLTEALPIATVLSSPADARLEKTPRGVVPPSPKAPSKKRSQYQYTSRVRTDDPKTSLGTSSAETSTDQSRGRTPEVRSRSRTSSFIPPPTIIRTSARSSLESLSRSQFSDSSDEHDSTGEEQSRSRARLCKRDESESKISQAPSLRRPRSTVRFATEHEQLETERKVSRDTDPTPRSQSALRTIRPDDRKEVLQDEWFDASTNHKEASSLKAAVSQPLSKTSQLPVPRQRKTNSALFRALEQPYDSSSSVTVASVDSTSGLTETNSDARSHSEYGSAGDSIEGLHAVSSDLSSLTGDPVGDIRWSDMSVGLGNAAAIMIKSLEEPRFKEDKAAVTTDAYSEDYQDSVVDGSNYDLGEGHSFSDGTGYETNDSGSQQGSSRPSEDRSYGRNQLNRMSMHDKRKAIHESWRASLEEDQFKRLQETLDPMELQRQQVIWEFCEGEEAFVDTLRVLIQLFIQPLRTQHRRQWIDGIAPDIMRLFDWLDDIASFHEQLLDAIESARQDQSPVTLRFSEIIRPFIPMMELYQPYVVRVEEVSQRIVSMALDPESDFGEFVRIQSNLPECEESLEKMLGRPLARLEEYVKTFQELLTLTPRIHADYLSTFSSLHSMHATICVLKEVKLREEEYDLVKNLLSRVRRLPSGFKIATRDRRLLAQGLLTQVSIPEDEPARSQRPNTSRLPAMLSVSGARSRSGSQSTAISSVTDSTSSSYRSTSSNAAHLGDSAPEYSIRSDSSATSDTTTHVDGRREGKLPSTTRTGIPSASRIGHSQPRDLRIERPIETDVYALVFTDCLVLARPTVDNLRPSRGPRRPSKEHWNTLDAMGIFRLLGVADYSGHNGYHHLLSLDLVSMGDRISDAIESPFFVAVPDSGKRTKNQLQEIEQARQEWSRSLHQCYLNTLRSISFSEDPLSNIEERPASRFSVTDDPAVGLQLPKSPSQQLEREAERKRARLSPIDNVEEEREERGFWAERFKRVFEDMRRTYEGIPFVTDPPPAPKSSQPKRTSLFRSSETYI